MSTRSTKILLESETLSVHIYHEMHDDEIHLNIDQNGSYSGIDIVLPRAWADDLVDLLKPFEETRDTQTRQSPQK
jgi:hypothetical protein